MDVSTITSSNYFSITFTLLKSDETSARSSRFLYAIFIIHSHILDINPLFFDRWKIVISVAFLKNKTEVHK